MKKLIGGILASAIAMLLLFTGCSKKTSDTQETEVIPVEVATVGKEIIDRKIELVGTLAAWKEANLGAQTTARIHRIYVEEGKEVREGDLLFEMDDTQLAQAKIQYELAKNDYERMKPLYEMGSISRSEFDRVKAAYENAEKVYTMMLSNIQFKAPFAGVITAKRMNEGEIFMLAPGAGGAPSIVQLMQLNPLKLLVNVSEVNFGEVKRGQNVSIVSDVYPGRVFSGVITRINPTINPATRTFEVEVRILNPDRKLRPGMFVRATIDIGKVSAVVVDRAAVLKQLGVNAYYAFVAEGNKAQRRTVKVGQEFDDRIEILEGLRIGDALVVKGQARLKDGSLIDIKNKGEAQ